MEVRKRVTLYLIILKMICIMNFANFVSCCFYSTSLPFNRNITHKMSPNENEFSDRISHPKFSLFKKLHHHPILSSSLLSATLHIDWVATLLPPWRLLARVFDWIALLLLGEDPVKWLFQGVISITAAEQITRRKNSPLENADRLTFWSRNIRSSAKGRPKNRTFKIYDNALEKKLFLCLLLNK